MAANRGSRRVMEKAGLVYISSFPYGGPETSPDPADWDVEYALTVSDWAAGKTASGTASH